MQIEAKTKTSEDPWPLPIQVKILKVMSNFIGNTEKDSNAIKYLREIEFEYFILRDKVKALEQKLNIDNKTGLLLYKPDYLQEIVKTATRYQDASKVSDIFCISYVRLDLDDFSEINTLYGHEMGDLVLIDVANTLKKTIRTTDYAIRFGGEEFDIILPYTCTEGGCTVAENLRKNISNLQFHFREKTFNITTSIGLATHERSIRGYYRKLQNLEFFWQNLNRIQIKADYACYDAKNSGKNCIKVYSPDVNYSKIRRQYLNKRKQL